VYEIRAVSTTIYIMQGEKKLLPNNQDKADINNICVSLQSSRTQYCQGQNTIFWCSAGALPLSLGITVTVQYLKEISYVRTAHCTVFLFQKYVYLLFSVPHQPAPTVINYQKEENLRNLSSRFMPIKLEKFIFYFSRKTRTMILP